jgi:micrococcal nuclease
VNAPRWLLASTVAVVLVAGVAVAIALAARGDDSDATSLPPDVGVVEWVIDGDTVDIDIGGREERVRLIGIDTPELHTDSGDAECMAREALEFTAAQLPAGTEVRLERDIVGRDDYGRLLAYVYRRADDVLINELVVAHGFARPLTIAPNDTYRERFVAAAHAAETADLGLWGSCAG